MENSNKSIKKIFERSSGTKHPITFKMQDGTLMVNATQMGMAFGETKKPVFFLRSKGTKAFINEMKRSADYNFGGLQLPYVTIKGGKDIKNQGTWMHEKLALKYAAWIAPSFELWVYENILELLKNGKVELDRPPMMSMEEHLDEQNQRENTKKVSREIYRQTKGDVGSIPRYHYNLTMKLTGIAPKEWQKLGKEKGLPKSVTSKGGKEVMRTLAPKFTCAISLADNVLATQKHLKVERDQQYVIDAAKEGIKMFEKLLQLGVHPNEEYGNRLKF